LQLKEKQISPTPYPRATGESAMKLYYHPASTTCRMIMLFAAEEGIALDYQLIDLMKG
jgi:hypothetical protein